jgi:hypothetical protein
MMIYSYFFDNSVIQRLCTTFVQKCYNALQFFKVIIKSVLNAGIYIGILQQGKGLDCPKNK